MTPQRKEELLKQLQRIECQLSPENLSCDGELSRSEINRRATSLNREQRAVIKELGYEPDFNEIYSV